MQMEKRKMREILACAPVLPVLTVHDADVAGNLARALVDGGVRVFEVLMRTPAAAEAIRAMVKAAPEAQVGAGTLLRAEDVERAVDAGAAFGVAPGLTEALGRAVNAAGLPFLPGVSTASEVMAAMEQGFLELKFFPAHGSAGITWLQSMAGVFPTVTFCPTGGIKVEHVPGYLALPNCGTIGCSWVAPADLVRTRDWKAITELARKAAAMKEARA
ncbi:ketohydroxyglutarate aldolase [Betaproteobacteria bacterium]|nr:ketohydroxyglutarate aldolase [Betaproteobacteria bacterium]